ncbi:hypothetical protein B9Z55_006938 [Caenorhabditis nigoni]|uniref:DUF38 domain-containing protein n=1 Tax=Caenorhabditis nigoni TaxID=1611254 RepID=A0A2G5V7E8_9PELO|nr:hypothetical protein B9Z55_006938 [Caenorhabditis nigoni]
MSVLKFPNFKFKTLELGQKWIIDKRFLEKLLLKIESSNLKIHVTTVSLNYSDHEIDILKFCENPEYVKINNSGKAPIEEIFSKLDKLGYSIFNKDEQSKQPKLILKYRKLVASEATEIVKTLLQYHNLKYCHLVGPFGMRTFKRNIFKFGAKSVPANQGHILHFPIPDSLDFFEIDCNEFIKIEKKSISIQ